MNGLRRHLDRWWHGDAALRTNHDGAPPPLPPMDLPTPPEHEIAYHRAVNRYTAARVRLDLATRHAERQVQAEVESLWQREPES